MKPPQAHCAQADLVLARFLDGDPTTKNSDSPAHLGSCPECQSALRRARRLDALLAQHSTIEVSDALGDRLLTAAFPAPVPPTRRRLPLVAGAAVLLIGGIAIGMWWRAPTTSRGRDAAADDVARRRTEEPKNELLTDLLPLPDAGKRRSFGHVTRTIRRTPRTRLTNATILRREDLASVILPTVGILQGLHGLAVPGSGIATFSWSSMRRTAARLARDARFEAGTKLMQSRRTSDHRQFVAFLATTTETPLLHDLLAAARDDAATVRRIHTALRRGRPGQEVIVAAARLGHPRLDAAIVRITRRWPLTSHATIEAIASTDNRPGRVAVLLDIWDELRARRALGSDETRLLESSFRQLPPAATAELMTAAQAAKRPDRRLQCLTALGWRRDPSSVGFLLRLVDSRHHETALASGHVLSRMPVSTEDEIAACIERSRRAYVLLAALCGMRSKLPRSKLRTTTLTREETAFLWDGAFNANQFGIACALCRRRSVLFD